MTHLHCDKVIRPLYFQYFFYLLLLLRGRYPQQPFPQSRLRITNQKFLDFQ